MYGGCALVTEPFAAKLSSLMTVGAFASSAKPDSKIIVFSPGTDLPVTLLVRCGAISGSSS